MNRQATVDHVATPSNPAPDAYRLLVTGRIERSQSPNGREPSVVAERPEDGADARHGSVYLPRWRFGSRRRRTPPEAA